MSTVGAATAPSSPRRHGLAVHCRLGRVSNLPTVWSNVLAAYVLAGGTASAMAIALAVVACSAWYTAGMYLNDACDADIDARERPDRPIPSGAISRQRVIAWSVAWMLAGAGCLMLARHYATTSHEHDAITAVLGPWLAAPAALIACIVIYDLWHKNNPFGPLLMAGCRAGVFLSVGYALVSEPDASLFLGAALAFVWIVGLTALAKRESSSRASLSPVHTLWPLVILASPVIYALWAVPSLPWSIVLAATLSGTILLARHWMRRGPGKHFGQAIGLLIAAVALVDAVLIASHGQYTLALVAAGCCPLTLLLQRKISGT